MIRELALVTVFALFWASPAAAQREPEEQCLRDPNLAPCLQSRADELVRTYGVRRIEAHRDAGDQVLRVFFRHNQELALIAFVRAPGRDPTATVYFPRMPRQPAPAPMEAPIPEAVWNEALRRAAYADRSLVPLPPDPDDRTICMHPDVFFFERADPAVPTLELAGRVRRHDADACEDPPLVQFARDLQRLVIPLFPACDALDSAAWGSGVSRLMTCRRLSGDRLTAARIMNLAEPLRRMRPPEDLRNLEELIEPGATIDWNGRRRGTGDGSAAAFWHARFAEDHVDALWIDEAVGVSEHRVRLSGRLLRYSSETSPTAKEARFEQIWATTYSGTQIVSITVGPWQDRPD